jgi:HK97 family phage major capsid protein
MNEKLAEMKRKRAALVAEMKMIVAKETDESPLEDGDKTRFDELKDAIDAHDERIGRLEDMISAEGGEEVDDSKQFESTLHKSNVMIQNKKNRSHEAKGTRAARFIIGAGLAKAHGLDAGVGFVRDALDDVEVSKALNATGTSAGGGLLVPQDYRAELIDVLWAESVVRSSNPTIIPMPMGQITLPRLSTTSAATWIGEQNDIASNLPSFDQIVLTAKKLAGIVPVQNDLIRRSPLAVESVVRTQMVKQLARAEDQAFLSGTGSSSQPKGIINWALPANVTNALTSPPTLSVVNSVLASAQLDLLASNVPTSNAMWFMNPNVRSFLSTLTDQTGRFFYKEELDRGSLFGMPYKMTTNLPSNLLSNGTAVTTTVSAATAQTTLVVTSSTGIVPGMNIAAAGITAVTTVVSVTDSTHIVVSPAASPSGGTGTFSYVTTPLVLAAMDQVLIGDTMEMFADSSDVASYYDGSATVSAYQRDQTVFRIITESDLNVMHPAAVSVTNVFNWLPLGAAYVGAQSYVTQAGTYPATGSLSATIV